MKAAVLMGSKNDYAVVSPAIETLQKFGVEVTARILSAHRTPDEVAEFSKNLTKNGYEVVIAAAGKAAHLAGVVAAYTTLPVIALPVKSSLLDGLDSLFSMVQMPAGIPVACVAVGSGENAGLLAVQILGIKYKDVAKKLLEHKAAMREKTLKDDADIRG